MMLFGQRSHNVKQLYKGLYMAAFLPYLPAIGGALGGLFGGGRKRAKKRSTLDKNQQKLNEEQHNSIFGKGALADLYNYNPEKANAVFDKNVANPSYRNFKEKLAPEITGSFRSKGLQNSSYAGDALAKLARDVQEGLDAKRSDYLYNQENNATSAKRNAVENLQNRTTFDYDTNNNSGFDINKILGGFTPQIASGLSNGFGMQNSPNKLPRNNGFTGSNGFSNYEIGIR